MTFAFQFVVKKTGEGYKHMVCVLYSTCSINYLGITKLKGRMSLFWFKASSAPSINALK